MEITSGPVKRGYYISGRIRSQVDIEQGSIQGSVPHKVFDSQKVSPVFIEMGAKGMAEGMAGEPVFPAKGIFMGPHMTADIKSINGTGRICLFREKPPGWSIVCKPVFGKDIKSVP